MLMFMALACGRGIAIFWLVLGQLWHWNGPDYVQKKPALSSVGYEGVPFHGDDEIQCVLESDSGKGHLVDQNEAI